MGNETTGEVGSAMEYEKPSVELITFENENVVTESGCNCQGDAGNNRIGIDPGCSGDSWDAEERQDPIV